MYSLLFLAVTSFLLSFGLTPLVRDLFHRLGIFDHPDTHRKLHTIPIPRVGGIAIALAYTLSFALLLLVRFNAGILIVSKSLPLIWKLLPAALLIFTIGLLDDLIHLKAWQKLLGQFAAAVVAFAAGIRIYGVAGAHFPSLLSLPLTIVWLVGCCNAVNLIDGVDGLAAGVSLVATMAMLIGAVLGHNIELALATLPLVGCLLGFLRYNFNPATVFLGDSGSLFIGFLLGCYGVLWSEKSATILGMTAPLLAMAIPLLDTFLAIARRFLRHQPIFTADRGHIHHRLLDRGFTPRGVALLLYAVCAIAAVFSLSMVNNHLEVPAILVFCVTAWLGIQNLGFVEFDTAGRMLVQGSFRKLLSSSIALKTFESKLATTQTADECWTVLRSSCSEFGFRDIEMQFAEYTFAESDSSFETTPAWRLQIPLSNGHIQMTRTVSLGRHNTLVAPLVEVLHRTVDPKLTEFSRISKLSPQQPPPTRYSSAAAGGD